MSFRDFVTNRRYRDWLASWFHRDPARPPRDRSRASMDRLVARLLDDERCDEAREMLEAVGADALPSLLAALDDPRFRAKTDGGSNEAIEAVLELIAPLDADAIVAAAPSLAADPSAHVRKAIALSLASLGRDDGVPVLVGLLDDVDGYVRAYVAMGAQRAAKSGTASAAFRGAMYDALLAQCDQKWAGTLNDAAEAVIALDRGRAAVDLGGPALLTIGNRELHRLLHACNEADLALPADALRRVIDDAWPRGGDHPFGYIVAYGIEAYARVAGEEARPLLERGATHPDARVRESSARAAARLAGIDDATGSVIDRVKRVDIDGLTPPERTYYLAFRFDTQVCNGGLMQFFANSSGDRAAETLDALRVLGEPTSIAALEGAMRAIGPMAREPDRDMRLAAFEDRYDALQKAFRPLESAFFATDGELRIAMLRYAAAHAERFRRAGA